MLAKDRRRVLLENISETREYSKEIGVGKNFSKRINNLERRVKRAGEVQLNREVFSTEIQKELRAIRNDLDSLKLKPWKLYKKLSSIVFYIIIAISLFFLFSDVLSTVLSSHKLDSVSKVSYIIITLIVDIILFICYVFLRNFQLSLFYGKNGEKIPNMGTGDKLVRSVVGMSFAANYFYFCFLIREITLNTIYPSSLPFLLNLYQITLQVTSSSPINAIVVLITLGASIYGLGKYVWDRINKKQKVTNL